MHDIFSVEGKVAFVSGGSRGIGEMIAAGLLAHGARVYICSRKAEACEQTAQRLNRNHNGMCKAIAADLSTLEGIESAVAEFTRFESHLNILVNNAGASWGAPLEEFPEAGWDKVMDVNVKGVFFLTQKFLPILERYATPEDPSRVINIGSIEGLRAPEFETFSYGPSKAAVHHLTRNLAAHLTKRNVLCNAIAPGPFPTQMLGSGIGASDDSDIKWKELARTNPRGRVGTPEDITGTVIFLSSRAGAFTVGNVITCDGGVLLLN
jgi:2-deoxy-D-gluconate 3-dehydrogenase